MQTHYLLDHLKRSDGTDWGLESCQRLAIHPSGNAVVFVHGFGGSAVETWVDFPTLLANEELFSGYDMFFFGYNSKYQDAHYSGNEVYEFLENLGSAPGPKILSPSMPRGVRVRPKGFLYQHIVICAHSLGAVVVRLALLEAGNQQPVRPWLQRVRLVLFAPAHTGARILPLISFALTGIKLPFTGGMASGKVIEALLKHRMPVLSDLDPKSLTLKRLRKDTLKALGPNYAINDHLRAQVLHAERDRIVRKDTFAGDFPMERFPGANHFEICKPTYYSRRPIDFLRQHMP